MPQHADKLRNNDNYVDKQEEDAKGLNDQLSLFAIVCIIIVVIVFIVVTVCKWRRNFGSIVASGESKSVESTKIENQPTFSGNISDKYLSRRKLRKNTKKKETKNTIQQYYYFITKLRHIRYV